MTNKKIGKYYTPAKLASWISQKVVNIPFPTGQVRILEPSCGDGVFFRALDGLRSHSQLAVDGVEIDGDALSVAHQSMPSSRLFNEDFLSWEAPHAYEIIMGNPPYISKTNLVSDQAAACKKIHVEAGLANKEISNIWTAFVVKAAQLLTSHGVLAFVIPTELLQVKYAQEIRSYLLQNFNRVEIISFKKLAFETLDQDTVILFAYKEAAEKGLYFTEVDSIEELSLGDVDFVRHEGAEDVKWTAFILNDEELELVGKLTQLCNPISSYCTSVAGIVTAANKFFIVSEATVMRYSLENFIKPIIQKGIFVNGSVKFTHANHEQLKADGKPCYLVDLNGVSEEFFTEGLVEYLALGESEKIPGRFKCALRDRWFDVPSIWNSEGFFFKRGHAYPKILDNQAEVFVTDAAYRIRMNPKRSMEGLVMSFYNSLTLLCAELFGRYYGGGVLELTPNEFKSLPLPYKDPQNAYAQFVNDFEAKESIEDILDVNDRRLLRCLPGVSETEIEIIHQLYKRVKQRRLRC